MAIAYYIEKKQQLLVTISHGAIFELIVHKTSLFSSVRISVSQLTIRVHQINTTNPGQINKITQITITYS